MPSIIGATHLIKHKRANKPKPKAQGAYKKRNELLPTIGYASYLEYLKSSDWLKIRNKVMRKYPECSCCDKQASQVHHHSYDPRVLLGLVTDLLFPLCDECHAKIEFTPDGRKRELHHVQNTLVPMLKPYMQTRLACGLIRLKRQDKEASRAWYKRNRKARKKPRRS